MKNIFVTLSVLILLSTNSYAAGSSSDNSSKVKSNYDKAVTIIKAAKKYEKQGKTEKANKKFEKALDLLVASNKMFCYLYSFSLVVGCNGTDLHDIRYTTHPSLQHTKLYLFHRPMPIIL